MNSGSELVSRYLNFVGDLAFAFADESYEPTKIDSAISSADQQLSINFVMFCLFNLLKSDEQNPNPSQPTYLLFMRFGRMLTSDRRDRILSNLVEYCIAKQICFSDVRPDTVNDYLKELIKKVPFAGCANQSQEEAHRTFHALAISLDSECRSLIHQQGAVRALRCFPPTVIRSMALLERSRMTNSRLNRVGIEHIVNRCNAAYELGLSLASPK